MLCFFAVKSSSATNWVLAINVNTFFFQVDPENLTVNAVLIAMASVVGLALLLNCRTWWQVADSVLNSQRKRLHSAADNLHKLKSEGFMKVQTKKNTNKTMNVYFC